MPYRDAPIEAPALTPDAGIVDDMVRQFADQYAFLRELVQNGIDAGATRIVVTVEEASDGRVITSVDDDGCGMTRKTIEGPLLTLFSSSKEDDTTKIGKYGVGFVSVFAIAPQRVEVVTWRDGETWRVSLFGDHSYELSTEPRKEGHGTIVSLHQPRGAFEGHAERVEGALAKWCRHAHLPITLVLDAGGSRREIAVNQALSLPGEVVVRAVVDGATYVVTAGALPVEEGRPPIPIENATFGGYYNRGLTLLETQETKPELRGIRFKIDSPRLAHTLSRDNIRHDAALSAAHKMVKQIARTDLRDALYERIAVEAGKAAGGDFTTFDTLVRSLRAPALGDVARSELLVPLATPIDGRSTMSLAEVEARSTLTPEWVLISDVATPIVRGLAKRRIPVLAHGKQGSVMGPFLDGRQTARVEVVATLVSAHADLPDTLETALVEIFGAAGRRVARARFASFSGAQKDADFMAIETDENELVVRYVSPAWGRSSTLFVNVARATVRLARRHAKKDPRIAAHLLCRSLLLADGPLPAKTVDALLAKASP